MAAATQCCLVLRKWSLVVIYSKYRTYSTYSMAIVKQSKYCLNLIIPLPQYLFHLPSDKLQQELALLGYQLSYTYLKKRIYYNQFHAPPEEMREKRRAILW